MILAPFKPPTGGSGDGSGETNLGANVGTGDGEVFRNKTGVTLNFKRLSAGAGIAITDNANDIEIAATGGGGGGEANDGANVGAGTGEIYRDKTGVDINLKTLIAGSNIGITNNADDIEIEFTGTLGEVNDGANVGTGDGEVFKDKTGVDLNFRTISAGSNIAITNNTNDIEVAAVLPTVLGSWQSGVYVYPANTVVLYFIAPFDLEITEIKLLASDAPVTAANYDFTATAPDGVVVTAYDMESMTDNTLASMTLVGANVNVLKDERVSFSFASDNADLTCSGLFIIMNYEAV